MGGMESANTPLGFARVLTAISAMLTPSQARQVATTLRAMDAPDAATRNFFANTAHTLDEYADDREAEQS